MRQVFHLLAAKEGGTLLGEEENVRRGAFESQGFLGRKTRIEMFILGGFTIRFREKSFQARRETLACAAQVLRA